MQDDLSVFGEVILHFFIALIVCVTVIKARF